jgi:hypothetical protein
MRLTEQGRRLGLVDDRRWAASLRKARGDRPRAGTPESRPGCNRPKLADGEALRVLGKGTGARIQPARSAAPPGCELPALMTLRLGEQAGRCRPERSAGHRAGRDPGQISGLHRTSAGRSGQEPGERGTRFPADFDFSDISGLSREVQQKLSLQRPQTLGQASRIQGMTPAAISILLVCLKRGSWTRRRRAAAGSLMSPADQLAAGLQILGIALPAPAQSTLLAYVALLEKWNRTYRLTAIPIRRWRSAIICSIRWRCCPSCDGAACLTSAVAAACPEFRWPSPARNCRSSCSTAIRRRRLSCNRRRSSWNWRILPYTVGGSRRIGRRPGLR